MGKIGRPNKEDKDKKVKYGISIDRHLFDKMKKKPHYPYAMFARQIYTRRRFFFCHMR
jgi:hypothetical protein